MNKQYVQGPGGLAFYYSSISKDSILMLTVISIIFLKEMGIPILQRAMALKVHFNMGERSLVPNVTPEQKSG